MTRPAENRRIAGIILAGGQSRRMGTDKAVLEIDNVRLMDIAHALLVEAGCQTVFVSGRPGVPNAIPDSRSGSGPAQAMLDCLEFLGGDFDGALFLPVDMPLLQTDDLAALLAGPSGHCRAWKNQPLPVFIPAGLDFPPRPEIHAVKFLLASLPVNWLSLTGERLDHFLNINSPDDVKRLDRRRG